MEQAIAMMGGMGLLDHFRMLASYNRVANRRLYGACGELEDAEYRRERDGPFGSIHGLLNHILLGDTIWVTRLEGGGSTTPPLNTVLHHGFAELRGARDEMDGRIQEFFEGAGEDLLQRNLPYVNSQGKSYVEKAPIAIAHLFNHQTHHRGQVCVMLARTAVRVPSLDLHRIVNP